MSNIKPQVDFNFNRKLVCFYDECSEHLLMATELGKFIHARLADMQKTQTWLAEKMNVSANAVSKWIKSGKISRTNFFALIDIIGSDGAPFIWEAIDTNKQQNHSMVAFSNDEKIVLQGFRSADESTKRVMLLTAQDALARFERRSDQQ